MGPAQIVEAVAVEGEEKPAETVPKTDMPEGHVPAPESAESKQKEDTAVTEEPPNKKARTSEMSPELESKFMKLMESTRLGFECTGKALASVQEHVDLLKKHSKELSDLAAEIHTSRVSEKYYLTQLQSLYAAFGQIEWQLAGPKSESNTSMKSVLNKLLGSSTSVKEGVKVLYEELKQGQGRVVEAIEKGFGTLCEALVKQPMTGLGVDRVQHFHHQFQGQDQFHLCHLCPRCQPCHQVQGMDCLVMQLHHRCRHL